MPAHAKKGWEHFTDRIIQVVSEQQPKLVFLLWGAHAQSRQKLIDATKAPGDLSSHRRYRLIGLYW